MFLEAKLVFAYSAEAEVASLGKFRGIFGVQFGIMLKFDFFNNGALVINKGSIIEGEDDYDPYYKMIKTIESIMNDAEEGIKQQFIEWVN